MPQNRQKQHYKMRDFVGDFEPVFLNISYNNDGELEHTHDFYELIAIVSGVGTHTINGHVYQVMPGDMFLLNYGDRHFFTPLDKCNDFKWINCLWLPKFHSINETSLLTTKKFTDKFNLNITNQLIDLYHEYTLKQQDYLDIIRLQLCVILKKLNRIANEADTTYSERHRRNIIKQVIDFINTHYTEHISLQDISDNLNISQVYLCKLFKEKMGMGAIQYLRKVRIDRAIAILMSTDHTIEEVSASVGFSDVKSFYSTFKAQMGVTPASYKLHREQELGQVKTLDVI